MNKYRYPEKKFLLKYDLSDDFFKKINVKAKDIIPLRKVFVLNTQSGKKVLKRLDYDEDRIVFVNTCIKNLRTIDKNIIKLNEFSDGKDYIYWKNNYYVLMDLLPEREVTFSNPIEFNMCGKALANLHLSSSKVLNNIAKDLNKEVEDLLDEDLISKMNKRIIDIYEIKKWVERYKYRNEFDSIFLSIVDEYIAEMKLAMELLKRTNYLEMRNNLSNVVVCHNDLAERNFLISNDDIYIIDFDYCSVDLKVIDIADLLLKGIKESAFDIDKSKEVLKEYSGIFNISKDEYSLLYILMLFPRDIFSIIKSYYHNEKQWDYDVFLDRFKSKLLNEGARRDFLQEFKKSLII